MQEQLMKIARGALIAAVGAGSTYAITELGNVDFGGWTPIVVAALSVLANAVRKALEAAATKLPGS